MYITDDPYKDFDHWDAEQTEWLEKRPVCENCKEHIQDDDYYELCGLKFCEDCINNAERKSVDDYLDSLEDY